MGEGQRGETIPSRFHSINTQPIVELELTNCEIMTWAKINSQTLNWLHHPGTHDLFSYVLLKFMCSKISYFDVQFHEMWQRYTICQSQSKYRTVFLLPQIPWCFPFIVPQLLTPILILWWLLIVFWPYYSFAFPRISYKWNVTICNFLSLASFS